jgi:hypothetical protein
MAIPDVVVGGLVLRGERIAIEFKKSSLRISDTTSPDL